MEINDGDPFKYFSFAWNHLTEQYAKERSELKSELDMAFDKNIELHERHVAPLDIKLHTLEKIAREGLTAKCEDTCKYCAVTRKLALKKIDELMGVK
ncbi:hypothetical protein N9948_00765 [bacterium]|nr:hypothetical protein [bacterium]